MTVAGDHGQGNGTGQLNHPAGLFVDEDQTIYVADWDNHRVMAWKAGTTTGELVAGGNGRGNRLDQLNHPTDVIVDRETDSLLICDAENQRVMRWPRCPFSFRQPEIVMDNIVCSRLIMDDQGSLYVSDRDKNEVRRYDKGSDKTGTIVAGGQGLGANPNQLKYPMYIFVDTDCTVYVSDYGNNRVMKWMKGVKEGIIVAGGNGSVGDLTQLSGPRGVWVDRYGHVYVADWGNHRVMRWEKGAKEGTMIVGGNGQGERPNQLCYPNGLFFDRYGHLYISDTGNHRVQRFSLSNC